MKTDNKTSKPVHAFEDGSFVTEDNLRAAKKEIQACLIFLGVPHTSVFNQRKSVPFPTRRVYDAMPETDECWLTAVAHEQLRQIRPRLSLKQLNNRECYCLHTGLATRRALAWKQGYQRIRETLNHIAGRPKGWSLLNLTAETSLVKLVKQCYGPERGSEIRRLEIFPESMLLQLVARRIKAEAADALPPKRKSPNRAKSG
ncbi:MAG: hypothetical protein U1F83_19555 [Verrucomicrobiota bacterium]